MIAQPISYSGSSLVWQLCVHQWWIEEALPFYLSVLVYNTLLFGQNHKFEVKIVTKSFSNVSVEIKKPLLII